MWYIVIVLFIIVFIAEIFFKKFIVFEKSNEENQDFSKEYVKKEYLLTQTELKFYKVLKTITDELNLVICPQVPLYGIVQNTQYKDFNKISKKSIDFVITETNLKIKLCIELDDYTHKQEKRIKRDEFVNDLFKATDIKLLRISVKNFYDREALKKELMEYL